MSKAKKPPLVKLCELQPGQQADAFVLLAEKTPRTTRDGKPFYSCRFRDRNRTVATVVWADSPHFPDCQGQWQPGQFFKIRGTYVEHERYGPQIEIEQIRVIEERDRAEGFSELNFREPTRFDPDALLTELHTLVAAEVRDVPFKALIERLLQTYATELKALPGSQRHYYPYPGGWLEHTINVTQNCIWLADRYTERFPDLKPALNRDLVIAGAILHDIGRVKELEAGILPNTVRTSVSGELFGHLFLGYELIRDAAREFPDLNPKVIELLLHVVVSHLRLPEWGSPKLPCIPEVLIVHHADDLDAKFEMFARCLTNDVADGPFTERDPILNRPLLKTRSV